MSFPRPSRGHLLGSPVFPPPRRSSHPSLLRTKSFASAPRTGSDDPDELKQCMGCHYGSLARGDRVRQHAVRLGSASKQASATPIGWSLTSTAQRTVDSTDPRGATRIRTKELQHALAMSPFCSLVAL